MEVALSVQSSTLDTCSSKMVRMKVECKAANNHDQKLHILVTEDSDPSFFYSLTITEDDFKRLKSEQNLLVDFLSFPAMITELIAKCDNKTNNSKPNFSLILDLVTYHTYNNIPIHSSSDMASNVSCLNFVERNQFKQLCHLSLKVVRGSDARVKEHLAECLKQQRQLFESSRQSLQSQLQQLQEQNNSLRSELKDKSDNLSCVRNSSAELSAQFEAKLALQVAKERTEGDKRLQEAKDKFESERLLWTDNNVIIQSKTQRKLENRVATLEVENRDLLDIKHRNKTQIERLTDQITLLREELSVLKNELETRKKDNREIERRDRELEKAHRELQTKSSVLEQERYRLQNDLVTKQQLLDSSNDQRKRVEKQLDEKIQLVAKREDSCKKVAQELHLALKTISKFKEQNIMEHKQVKASSKVIDELTEAVSTKDEELKTLKVSLEDAHKELLEVKGTGKGLREEEERLKCTIDDLEKRLKTNEQVIHWLNKQLSTAQARDPSLRLTTLPPDGLSFTPSNMAAVSTPINASNKMTTNNKKKSVTIVTRPGMNKAHRVEDSKENKGLSGLDENYLTNKGKPGAIVKTLNGGLVRQLSPPVVNLPSNVLKKSTTAPSTVGLQDLTEFPRT